MSTAYRTATAASHLLQPWPSQTSLDTIQCQLQPLIRQHQPLLCKTCNTNQAQFIIQNLFKYILPKPLVSISPKQRSTQPCIGVEKHHHQQNSSVKFV